MTETRYFSLARHALAEALRAADVKTGDRVALPEFICRDVLSSVHHVGAKIVYYPVNESLVPVCFPEVSGIKAIIAVNYFGFAQQLDLFYGYCKTNNTVLIEDNAHGFLSSDKNGAKLGTRAQFGITSIRKTIRVADGALLLINDEKFIDQVVPQLPTTSHRTIRLGIFRLIAEIDTLFHLPLVGALRSLSRLVRKFRTGEALPVSDPASETHPLVIEGPHMSSIRILARLDEKKEQTRRCELYVKIHSALADLPLRPICPKLPAGTTPYGYPFFADDDTAKLAGRISWRFGVEIIKWPDLPSAVELNAPLHYKNLWLVNFL